MKIFLTGCNGQLGKEFVKYFDAHSSQYEYKGTDFLDLDITNLKRVTEVIKSYKPDLIINCAAYNLVDEAETDSKIAYNVNELGVINLSTVAKILGVRLIHFSTDYVFDGSLNRVYTEDDLTNPVNIYGKSKLAGEERVLESDNNLVFRLSWVYGDGNQNFIYKFLNWYKNQDLVMISDNEISIPTSTKVVVENTIKALEYDLTGLWHLTNSRYCSRYNWVKEIIKIKSLKVKITPMNIEHFGLRAKRPLFSAMSNANLCKELDIEIPDWKESLKDFLLK